MASPWKLWCVVDAGAQRKSTAVGQYLLISCMDHCGRILFVLPVIHHHMTPFLQKPHSLHFKSLLFTVEASELHSPFQLWAFRRLVRLYCVLKFAELSSLMLWNAWYEEWGWGRHWAAVLGHCCPACFEVMKTLLCFASDCWRNVFCRVSSCCCLRLFVLGVCI